jgi:haloalkane dehalogenase
MASAEEHAKRFIQVDGRRMAYIEMGEGSPIVFQHGNPTSSYLWRNVMPMLAHRGRCIALDLIGMGDSDKLINSGPDSYTYAEQRRYFDNALEALGVGDDVVLIVHDWGSALGFDWAQRHPQSVRGICYMEAIVRPLAWDEFPDRSRGIFQGFRSEAGEGMVLENNLFVERVLPGSVLRELSEEEMSVYRRPFTEPGNTRSTKRLFSNTIPSPASERNPWKMPRDLSGNSSHASGRTIASM